MAYTLNGTEIRRPMEITPEKNSTQYAQHRTLDGTIKRDYFGDNKRTWVLRYRNVLKTDFDTINTIYQTYLSTGTAVAFISTETNYAISSTNVHMNLDERSFSTGGESYISDFDLVLTEV